VTTEELGLRLHLVDQATGYTAEHYDAELTHGNNKCYSVPRTGPLTDHCLQCFDAIGWVR